MTLLVVLHSLVEVRLAKRTVIAKTANLGGNSPPQPLLLRRRSHHAVTAMRLPPRPVTDTVAWPGDGTTGLHRAGSRGFGGTRDTQFQARASETATRAHLDHRFSGSSRRQRLEHLHQS